MQCFHRPHLHAHLKSPKLDVRDSNSTSSLTTVTSSTGTDSVVDAACGSFQPPKVLCFNHYASVLAGDFFRQVVDVVGQEDTFPSTSIPADLNFKVVAEADFVVFDQP